MTHNNTLGGVIMTNQTNQKSHIRALRLSQVIEKTGIPASTIYAKAKIGDFPKPIKLGNGRSSAWLEHEVDQWLVEQIELSRLSEVGDI